VDPHLAARGSHIAEFVGEREHSKTEPMDDIIGGDKRRLLS
jgi:hypothetical protein